MGINRDTRIVLIYHNYSGCQVQRSRFRVGYFELFIFFEVGDESTNGSPGFAGFVWRARSPLQVLASLLDGTLFE